MKSRKIHSNKIPCKYEMRVTGSEKKDGEIRMKYCMKLALLNQLRDKDLITSDEYERIKGYIKEKHRFSNIGWIK